MESQINCLNMVQLCSKVIRILNDTGSVEEVENGSFVRWNSVKISIN